jgi:tetratricopeptide (TPR) repeat protein
MRSKPSLYMAALLGLLCLPLQALAEKTKPVNPATLANLHKQIVEIEWNLKSSSLATKLDKAVVDKSIASLRIAESELAAGHWRTASGLIERAALPLHEMSPQAMAGKHPDERQWLSDLRQTLSSITDSSEKIAREKNLPTDFASMARSAMARSVELEAQGKPDKAMEIVEQAYLAVQQKVAELRDGENFYLAVNRSPDARLWVEGLRRFDDRKHLTEVLIAEATAEGIDASPLREAMQAAESSLQKATQLAKAERWELAMQSLEVAYQSFENSWRKVGVDW